MVRFILRVFSLVALVIAVMAGTIDAIQSVSASEPVLTPLAVAWSTASPDTIALVADGIPAASFAVDDVAASHAELTAQGVRFTQEPTVMGPVATAVLDDTCGNLIQLTSPV